MRIAHTSDWHAGRVFKREPRLPELAAVLENLGDALEREKVDLLLMSGDVFDSGAPVAEAERLVFGFFKRVGRAGIETIVIAGNHDSPARVEAWGGLAELVGVHAVARPRAAERGGVVPIERRGETALVAAIPFAAPRDLVSALEMVQDDTLAKQRYAEGMRAIVENVTAPFRADTVNLLMLHTHLEGAVFSGSERSVHLGEEWAATPQVLPPTAHYVALGHIHKPQKVSTAGVTALYAGSPLQMDFGEAGEEKSFVLVDARPRQPARWERVPYRGGRALARFRLKLCEIERDAARLAQAGWLWVTVPLQVPDPDINGKVRKLLPNVLRVEVELPESVDEPKGGVARLSMDQVQLFHAYHQEKHGVAPGPDVLEVFKTLYAEEHQG